jgi:nucleotidyltransferase substrate binding protein (TIGR01987 family)
MSRGRSRNVRNLGLASKSAMNRPHLDLSALRNAVASLEGAVGIVGNTPWFDGQTPIVQNTLMAGVIQNFEFVYELSIKMIRRQIELDSDSPDEIDRTSFRDLLRLAAEKGLIADVEAWFLYRRMRNLSAHTYDREKARQVYQDTPRFVTDARSLLAVLEARNG